MQRARPLALLVVWVVVLAWAVGPAAAQEHPPAAGHPAPAAKGGHDGHGESGSIDIFKPALDLGIWSLVVFLVLFWILTKYAWKPMLEGPRKREESIHNAIREADLAREEAHRLR